MSLSFAYKALMSSPRSVRRPNPLRAAEAGALPQLTTRRTKSFIAPAVSKFGVPIEDENNDTTTAAPSLKTVFAGDPKPTAAAASARPAVVAPVNADPSLEAGLPRIQGGQDTSTSDQSPKLGSSAPLVDDVSQAPQLSSTDFETNPTDKLAPGEQLESFINGSIYSSNGIYRLVQQRDSNLVLYKGNYPLWSNGAQWRNVVKTVMQPDGNLVSYTFNGTAVWASGTNNSPGAYLVLQNDGNLVIYDTHLPADDIPIWASNTVQADD